MLNTNSSDFSLRELEHSLKKDLKPVLPDHGFVGRLRDRLVDSTGNQQQKQLAYKLLTIAGGLLVGLMTFLIGRRIIEKGE
jgi:hypothetical protein